MKRFCFIFLLCFAFLLPSKSYAAVELSGVTFDEFEKNTKDLTEGLFYPLVKDQIFDEDGNYNFMDPMRYGEDDLGPYTKYITYYGHESKYKYLLIASEKSWDFSKTKIYGRVGNQAKLLIDVNHPDYVDEFHSYFQCYGFSKGSYDYFKINFYSKHVVDWSQTANEFIYRIGPKGGVEEVTSIPEGASPMDSYDLTYEDADGSPEGDSLGMWQDFQLCEFYNSFIKGQNINDFKNFFGSMDDNNFFKFRQALVPLVSEYAPDGSIDSNFVFTILQDVIASGFDSVEHTPNDIHDVFNGFNIFEDLNRTIKENYDEDIRSIPGPWKFNRKVFDDLFNNCYKSPLVEGDYSFETKVGVAKTTIGPDSLQITCTGSLQGENNSLNLLALSNIKVKDDYALFKAAAQRFYSVYGFCFNGYDNVIKNIIVRREKLDDGYEFVPIYVNKGEISEEDFQRIVSEDEAKLGPKDDKEDKESEILLDDNDYTNEKFLLGIYIAISAFIIFIILVLTIYFKKRKKRKRF